MNDFEFKSIVQSDLISEILHLGSSINLIPNISANANHFFQNIGIPQYSQIEIKQIQNKYISIQLDGGDVSDLLLEYSFNFPYDTNLLDDIRVVDPSAKNSNSISDYDFVSIISLYSFLSWMMAIQLKKEMPPSKSLIKNLLFARKSTYKNLIDRAFLSTMTIFLKFSKEDDMYSVADDFLTYVRHIKCPDLIIQFLRRFWKFPTFITNSLFFEFIKKLAITIDTIFKSTKTNQKLSHNYFNDNHINSIVKIMNTFITKLDISALELLVAIGHPLPIDSARLIIPTFGKSLEPLIMVHKPINLSFDSNSIEPLPKMDFSDLKLDFPELDSFPQGFTLHHRFTFPDPISINDIFNSTIIEPITKIAQLMANNPQYISLFVNSFNDSLRMHSDTEYFSSLFAVLIGICSMIKGIYLNHNNNSSTITKDNLIYYDESHQAHFLFPTDICFKFFNQKIFNPSITLYNNTKNDSFSIINTLRHLSLELILADDGSAFEEILQNSIFTYPLLFAEVTERLNFNISLLYSKIFNNNKLIDIFIRSAVNYQRAEMNSKQCCINEIRKARTTLFSLFNDLLMIPQGLILFFTRPVFSLNFLAFAFEDKLTKFVFHFYKNFLIAATPEEVESTTSTIFTIFTVIVSKFTSVHSKEILLTILESINDAMTNHPQINFLFADDCNIIFLALPLISQSNLRKNTMDTTDGLIKAVNVEVKTTPTTLRKRKTLAVIKPAHQKISDVTEMNQKLLKEMVQFFAQTASFYTISEDQVDLLITALQSFKDPEFVSSGYNRFIQLLAGECLPSLKPFFTIRQPQILKLFIRVLIDSPKLPEILEFINELCNFSVQNIKTCAASELDLFLADLLKRDKIEEKLSEKTVKLILNLFTLLSVRHSSIYAVYKYIELLSPVSPNQIYRHEQLLLETLDAIVNKSILEPASSFTLTDDNVISIQLQEITPNDLLDKGFTTAFWLNIEETHIGYEPTIFKLEINNDIVIGLSIQHMSLTVTILDAQFISSENIFTFSDTNIWHFVSISFQFEETRVSVKVDIDFQGGNNTFYFPELNHPHEANPKQLIFLTLGGYNNWDNEPASNIDFDDVQFPSRIANFGVFPLLNSDQRIKIFELGKRIIDLVDFNSSDSVQPLKYFYKFKKQNSAPIGFLNILTQQCGLLSLMPIFTLRGFQFKDGTPFNIDFTFALQLLRNILCSSLRCQKKFYNESGLTILRNLIIKHWMDEYSLNTYKYIFSLLQSLKHEELQLQLFTDLLADYGILMKIQSKQIQYKIIKHWTQSLFDSYRGLAEKADIITKIMPAIIELFEGDEYKMHRKSLYTFLHNYAEWGHFNMSFIEHLMSHSLYCKNINIIFEINNLINLLITDLPSELFTFKMETNSFLFFINFYLNHSNDLIQEQIMTIYINAYQRQLISRQYAFQSVYLFIEKYSSVGESSSHLIQFISNHLLDGPFFLPMLFFLAIKLNTSNDISSYLKDKQSSDYLVGHHWALWPLLYCYKYPTQQESVLTFLLNCCNGNYCQLFAQIQFTFFNHELMLDKITEKFISILQVHSIRNNMVSIDFYEISEFIIFFKLIGATVVKSLSKNDIMIHQQALLNSQSLFYQKVPISNNVSSNRLQIERIIQFPTSLAIIEFGIKYLIETSEWRHKTLAIQTIQFFRKQLSNDSTNESIHIKNRYLFFVLSLCGFLETTPYDGIRDFLNWLDLKEPEIHENKVAIQFINYRKVRSGKEPIEEFGKVTSPLINESNYNQFVEKNKPTKLDTLICDTFKYLEMFLKLLKDKCIETTYESELMYSIEAKRLTKLLRKNLDKSDKQGKTIWKRVWKVLTFDNSPWHITSKNPVSFDDRPIETDAEYQPILYPIVPSKLLPIKPSINLEPFEGKILFKAKNCYLVTIKKKRPITLIVYPDGATFKESNKVFHLLNSWIDEIIIKHRDDFCGFELYTVFGITYCVETQSMEITLNFIEALEFLNKNPNVQLANYTNKWVNNQISNFEYISILNKYAGRSFNEIDFYPIAPWLTFSSGFVESEQTGKLERDLKKPINKVLKNAQSQTVNQKDVCMYLSLVKPFSSLNQNNDSDLNQINPSTTTSNSSTTQISDEIHPNVETIIVNQQQPHLQNNDSNKNETNLEGIAPYLNENELSIEGIVGNSNENEPDTSNQQSTKSIHFISNESNAQNETPKTTEKVNNEPTITYTSEIPIPEAIIVDTQDELKQYSNTSNSELIPEFFSFERISQLGIDFAYKHRQILEDPNVSASIHQWFSLTFSSLFNPNTSLNSSVSFPHRKFFFAPNSFENTITIETRTPNIASACFIDSLHVQIFSLFVNSSKMNSTHSTKITEGHQQSTPPKSKSRFSKLKTSTNEDILQTVRLYGFSFISRNQNGMNLTDDMGNPLLMKEARSENSLLHHFDSPTLDSKSQSRYKTKHKLKDKFLRKRKASNEEMITTNNVTFQRIQKVIESPIFNKVTSIYNSSICSFIDSESLPFISYSPMITVSKSSQYDYNRNMAKNRRNGMEPNRNTSRTKRTDTIAFVCASRSEGYWAVLLGGFVYVIEFIKRHKNDSQHSSIVSISSADNLNSPSMTSITSSPSLNEMSTSSSEDSIVSSGSNLVHDSSHLSINSPLTSSSNPLFIYMLPTKNVYFIACDGKWIVVASDSSMINVFYNKSHFTTIETFEDKIEFITINEKKKACACIAHHTVLICDLLCGCVNAVVPSLKNAKQIVITDEWGFIVVYSESKRKRKFFVFTINGDFVHEIQISEKVSLMKSITTVKGIDYLFYTLESGPLYIMNLFEETIKGPLLNTGIDRITDVYYDERNGIISTVTIGGNVSFTPLGML